MSSQRLSFEPEYTNPSMIARPEDKETVKELIMDTQQSKTLYKVNDKAFQIQIVTLLRKLQQGV